MPRRCRSWRWSCGDWREGGRDIASLAGEPWRLAAPGRVARRACTMERRESANAAGSFGGLRRVFGSSGAKARLPIYEPGVERRPSSSQAVLAAAGVKWCYWVNNDLLFSHARRPRPALRGGAERRPTASSQQFFLVGRAVQYKRLLPSGATGKKSGSLLPLVCAFNPILSEY